MRASRDPVHPKPPTHDAVGSRQPSLGVLASAMKGVAMGIIGLLVALILLVILLRLIA